MIEEKVILVNENDEQIGLMPKMEAHEKAVLHRAFSVFIFNDKNELMLQQRALDKYHSPGLWTNTCCSHQRDGETNIEAGKRRLQEEMGFVTELEETISFIYKAPFDNGLTEHELDHVLIGKYNNEPSINLNEVASWKWMALEDVKNDIILNPDLYTEWFKVIFDKFYENINVTTHEGNSK
ncbi:isopentenyl-diphosphate Delta-isomerase [Seonamhaeicola sp. MEBiC1930]|uniref:isopentenyl-diphosphate Delta-isomerase n=1 Tax=Seonamhaeicola sp. MEBiC01930 TaxID=2976768 RepID=UPI0032524F9C